MKVAIAADHAGFLYKTLIKEYLEKLGYEVLDLGTKNDIPSDYPDHAEDLAKAMIRGQAEKGILICGSGVGICIAANKFRGIRAGICHDTYSAHQGVEHDNMNVLCIGQRVIGIEPAKEIVHAFLHAVFSGEPRHEKRYKKIIGIENKNMKRE